MASRERPERYFIALKTPIVVRNIVAKAHSYHSDIFLNNLTTPFLFERGLCFVPVQ
jgi:hypothetical protein